MTLASIGAGAPEAKPAICWCSAKVNQSALIPPSRITNSLRGQTKGEDHGAGEMAHSRPCSRSTSLLGPPTGVHYAILAGERTETLRSSPL